LTAVVAGLALRGDLAPWHLALYAGATGITAAFFLPASMAVVPEVLPPEQVRRGNALWSLGFNLARAVAPPLAGVVVAAGGAPAAFAFNAASFFVAAWAFARAPGAPRAPAPGGAPLRQLAEGVRAARRDPVVWACVLIAPVYTLGSMGATLVGLPALAKLALGAGDPGVGLLLGAWGAGAVLGAFATDAVAARPRQGVVGGLLCLGVGAGLALTGLAPALWVAVPALALAGALQTAAVVVFLTLVQTRPPPAVRGRVLSLYMLGVFGLTPLSFVLAGVGADALGPRAVLVVGGALVGLCGALLLAVRAVRDLP
jgi:predicted MFS family arabinose efflux permease